MGKKNVFITLIMSVLALNVSAAETVPGEQAEKNGFRTCQKTVDALAKFVVDENKYSSLATWNKNTADTRMFNSQVAVKYSDGNSVAILNVAPTKSGKCDSSYTTIFANEKSCSVLRETIFKDWKFSGEIAGLVVLENKGGSVSKILLPNGTGCVTINTEVSYD